MKNKQAIRERTDKNIINDGDRVLNENIRFKFYFENKTFNHQTFFTAKLKN